MAQQKQSKVSVEDDEFEEFDYEDWTEQQEDPKNAGLWERDWDDDSLNDDLSKSLREQLSKPAQPKS
ncbi:g2249 [Coccomyxa elongata]